MEELEKKEKKQKKESFKRKIKNDIRRIEIFLVVIVLILSSVFIGMLQIETRKIQSLLSRVETLEQNFKNSNENVSNKIKVSDKAEGNYENYEAYFDKIFETDGKTYECKMKGVTFFSDIELKDPIFEPIFASRDYEYVGKNEAGFQIYAYRLNDGEICYSLFELDKWNDSHFIEYK